VAIVAVFGASRGIGAAVAERFVKAGDRVAATHRGTGLPDLGAVLPVTCDVRSSESVHDAFAEIEATFGPPDIVVVNAAVVADGLLARMSEVQWQTTLDTNLTGAWRVAQRAVRPMMKARHGSLVFISSAAAAVGAAGQVNYCAAKAGLVGLARSIVRELGPRGIRANVVAPGPTHTDMTAALTEQQRAHLLSAVPLGRYAHPEEVAEVVELVSRATFMAGAIVPVDGGAAMGD
jgi:3-oxoacyl-[acyl-carrier protein] reductase